VSFEAQEWEWNLSRPKIGSAFGTAAL